MNMLVIWGSICYGQVIRANISLNMGGQFDSVGINIIVEHIYGGMWIIPNGDSFGDMVLQLGFIFQGGRTYTWHPNF